MSKKQFFVGRDGSLSWNKTPRPASWIAGKRVPFYGHGLLVEALEQDGGLYFSRELFADILRECASDEELRRSWGSSSAARKAATMLPEVIRMDEARFGDEHVICGRRVVCLRPADFPDLILKEALDRAAAAAFAKPRRKAA